VKPAATGAIAEDEEPSDRICRPDGDPRIGCWRMDAIVANAAMPNAIAIIARNGISVLLCPSLPFVCTSILSCVSDISLDFNAS